MNQEFKNWVVKQFKQKQFKQMNPKEKRALLRTLKFHPGKMMKIISSNLSNMGLDFAVSKGGMCTIDHEHDPQELLKALQKHFAKEMATITK